MTFFPALNKYFISPLLFLMITLVLSACGGGGGGGDSVTLSSIAISPSSFNLTAGDTQQLTATATYSDGSTANITGSVTWASSNTAVVSVNTTGLLTAIGAGTFIVTASLDGVTNNTSQSSVLPVLTDIVISPANASITVGSTQQFQAQGVFSDSSTVDITSSVAWDSSNTNIVTVDAAGLANGVAVGGPVTLTASLSGVNGSATLSVTAVPVVLQSITVTPASATILDGSTQSYTAVGNYSDGSSPDITSSVSWVSSDAGVASINSLGLATGVSAGTVTITASLSGIDGSASLTVNPVLTGISVSPATATIDEGATQAFSATGNYSDGSSSVITSSVSWLSSDTGVATVSSAGLATGVAAGTATMTASLDGVDGTATLTVNAILTGITVSPIDPTVGEGATQAFTAMGDYSDGSSADITTSVTWVTSDTNIATIGTDGVATGVLAGGPVTITASLDGQSDNTTLTVDRRLVADVPFLDANLQACAEAAGTYVEDITSLDCNNNGISNLAGLEEFTSLTSLYLHDNSINDLTPLASLTSLNILTLYGNLIVDLSPLSTLTALTQLLLGDNFIADVSPLSALTNLTELLLLNNQVSNIDPLANLTNLTQLDLDNNLIDQTSSDLSLLSALTVLARLDLGDNNITDVADLPAISTLVFLDLANNGISDATPIGAMTLPLLVELDLGGNSIADIAPLASLSSLQILRIWGNGISDVTSLTATNYPNLVLLDIFLNSITTITVSDIGSLTTLEQLYLGNNSITDITVLGALTNLQILYLKHNAIATLAPLATLTALVELNLEDATTGDADIATLASLTTLTILDARNNAITDVSGLSALTAIDILNLDNNAGITTGVADLVSLVNATSISFVGDTSIPCADLDTLDATLGAGIVVRPGSCL